MGDDDDMQPASDPTDPVAAPRAMPRTAKGRAMRARLVDAAIGCFAANGYANTAVADITAAVDTSHGNFYRYFDNVADVLLAAATGPLASLAEAGRPPLGSQALSLDALVDWQQRFLLAYAKDRLIFAVLREAADADRGSGFATTWQQLRAAFVAVVEQWIVAVESLAGPDPDAATPSELAEVLGAMGEQVAHVHLGLAAGEPDVDAVLALGRAMSLTCYRTVVLPRNPGAGAARGRVTR